MSLLLGTVCVVPANASPASAIDERLLEQERATMTLPPLQRLEGLVGTYEAWLPAGAGRGTCSRLATEDVEPGFRATAHLAKYVADDTWLSRLRCLHDELEVRGLASPAYREDVFDALVAMRRFPEANKLIAQDQSSRQRLPVIDDDVRSQQGVLELQPGGRVRWKPWYYRAGWEVIAFVHPRCGFSRRALARISRDPRWSWLRSRLRLVVQREPRWAEEDVREWNALNPGLPMQLQAGAAGWGRLDSYETPVFHLLRNGKIESTVVGWQDDGVQLDAFRPRMARAL